VTAHRVCAAGYRVHIFANLKAICIGVEARFWYCKAWHCHARLSSIEEPAEPEKTMPFTVRELITSAHHRLIGIGRILKSQSRDHHIEAMKQRGVTLYPVTEASRHVVNCPLCGYAMASMPVADDWIVETCSAFLLADMVKNPNFAKFIGRFRQEKDASVTQASEDRSRSFVAPAKPDRAEVSLSAQKTG
jgi:hypothetical protein